MIRITANMLSTNTLIFNIFATVMTKALDFIQLSNNNKLMLYTIF